MLCVKNPLKGPGSTVKIWLTVNRRNIFYLIIYLTKIFNLGMNILVIHGTAMFFCLKMISYRSNRFVFLLNLTKFAQCIFALKIKILSPATVRILKINHIFCKSKNLICIIKFIGRNAVFILIACMIKAVAKSTYVDGIVTGFA